MFETIVVGVLSSVAASVIFLVCLYQLRPKILFSNFIADQSDNGKKEFAFKILNDSRWSAVDLEIELSCITPITISNGTALAHEVLPLKKNSLFELPGYSKKDIDAKYALRFTTYVDLTSVCKSQSEYLLVKIKARHAISGFTKVFTHKFSPKHVVKKGRHEFGKGLDIK
jgi:hypothetical protein